MTNVWPGTLTSGICSPQSELKVIVLYRFDTEPTNLQKKFANSKLVSKIMILAIHGCKIMDIIVNCEIPWILSTQKCSGYGV